MFQETEHYLSSNERHEEESILLKRTVAQEIKNVSALYGEGSLPSSQELIIGLYSDTTESSLQSHPLILLKYILIVSFIQFSI
jgi:hypothetical protein